MALADLMSGAALVVGAGPKSCPDAMAIADLMSGAGLVVGADQMACPEPYGTRRRHK